jgi:DNA-binding transcriptional regulator YiaG
LARRSPDPSPQTVARLARLLARYQEAARGQNEAHDQLCRELVKLRRKEGLSARALAKALGVGSSTVQHWAKRGESLLDG